MSQPDLERQIWLNYPLMAFMKEPTDMKLETAI